jgi:RNA polymerase sigma factor (sigma-70 family)
MAAWHDQRHAESFRTLCDRYCGLVAATCRRQDSPDVAEAVQAVFLVLARRSGSVSGTNLGGWLTTTAKRVVNNQHRASTRRRRHEQEAAVEQTRQRAADGADPSWDEARQHLDAALASLSAGRREAILRFYLAGRPQAEVAAELGCSVAAVKIRVHEGLERLRVFFARKGIALGGVALASGLASEATASEPALVATCVQTVLDPSTAPAASALAHGVVTAMILKTTLLATAATILVGSCLTAALVLGAEPPPPASTAPVPLATAPVPLDPSANAALDWWRAFEFLPEKDAPIWKLAEAPNSPLPDPTADSVFKGSCRSLGLLALGAANPYCAWGLDVSSEGAGGFAPHVGKMRPLVELGLLRARWHAQRGEKAEAVDDLLTVLRTARIFSSRRPLLIESLLGFSLESLAISIAGKIAPQLDTVQRQRLLAALPGLPGGSTIADALDGDLDMMRCEVTTLLAMPVGQRVSALINLTGQSGRIGVLGALGTWSQATDASLKALLVAYPLEIARWKSLLRRPPAERLRPEPRFTTGDRAPHPLIDRLMPNWSSFAASEIRVLLLREQLSAALDYLDRGEPALAGHLDILTGKPFQLEKTATGFRLTASIPGQQKGAELTVGEASPEAPATATPPSDF